MNSFNKTEAAFFPYKPCFFRIQIVFEAHHLDWFIFLSVQLQEQDLNEIVALIVQYLPYLTITVLNFAIPIVFQKIVHYEDYAPDLALRITLFR